VLYSSCYQPKTEKTKGDSILTFIHYENQKLTNN